MLYTVEAAMDAFLYGPASAQEPNLVAP